MIYLTQDLTAKIVQLSFGYSLVDTRKVCKIRQNVVDLDSQIKKYQHMGYNVLEQSAWVLRTNRQDRLIIAYIITDTTYNLFIITNTELIDVGGFTDLVNSKAWDGFDSGGIYDKYNNRLEKYKSNGIVLYADDVVSKFKRDKFITFKNNLGKGKLNKLITIYNASIIANQGTHTLVKYKSDNKTIIASDAEIILPVNCNRLFHGMIFDSIDFKELNTEFVVDIQYMFSNAIAHDISFTNFKAKPNIINGLFANAQIYEISMSGLDITNAVSINTMFYGTTSKIIDTNTLSLENTRRADYFIADLIIPNIDLRGMNFSGINTDMYILSNISTEVLDLSDCKINMNSISHFMKDVEIDSLILDNWTESNRELFLSEILNPIYNNKIKEILGRCIEN